LFKHRRRDLAGEGFVGRTINPINGEPYKKARVKGTTQIRAGAEYLFILQRTVVPARAGIFYDPEPGRKLNHFVGVAVGSGVSIGDFIIDAAYQFRFTVGAEPDVVNLNAQDNSQGGAVFANTNEAKGGAIWQHLVYVSTIYHY